MRTHVRSHTRRANLRPASITYAETKGKMLTGHAKDYDVYADAEGRTYEYRDTPAHVVKEEIMGDPPIYHVFYANDTKSEQFSNYRAAVAYKNKLNDEMK